MKDETLVVHLLQLGEDGRFKVELISKDKHLNVSEQMVLCGAAIHAV